MSLGTKLKPSLCANLWSKSKGLIIAIPICFVLRTFESTYWNIGCTNIFGSRLLLVVFGSSLINMSLPLICSYLLKLHVNICNTSSVAWKDWSDDFISPKVYLLFRELTLKNFAVKRVCYGVILGWVTPRKVSNAACEQV